MASVSLHPCTEVKAGLGLWDCNPPHQGSWSPWSHCLFELSWEPLETVSTLSKPQAQLSPSKMAHSQSPPPQRSERNSSSTIHCTHCGLLHPLFWSTGALLYGGLCSLQHSLCVFSFKLTLPWASLCWGGGHHMLPPSSLKFFSLLCKLQFLF